MVDTVDEVDRVYMGELSLLKPGGRKASLRGQTSQESALPTSLLACPSGGWPLNVLEVRIVGSMQYKRLDVYSSQKIISSSFQLTVILFREVTELTMLTEFKQLTRLTNLMGLIELTKFTELTQLTDLTRLTGLTELTSLIELARLTELTRLQRRQG